MSTLRGVEDALRGNAYWTSEFKQLDGKSADGLRKVYAEGVDRESYPTFEGWVWDMERSGIVFRHEEERSEMSEQYVWVVDFYVDEHYDMRDGGVELFATRGAALGWLDENGFRLTRTVGSVELYEAHTVGEVFGELCDCDMYVLLEKQEVRTGNERDEPARAVEEPLEMYPACAKCEAVDGITAYHTVCKMHRRLQCDSAEEAESWVNSERYERYLAMLADK